MFKDLVVLELASVLAGPLVGSFFSELGARVIKVENPLTGGDVTRKWKMEIEDPDSSISAYYACANFNKEIRFLNIAEEDDYSTLTELIKVSDLVIVNYKNDSAKRLKIDYESINSINPGIIYASITGYGEESSRPAFDMILQAESGLLSMTGEKDRKPSKIPVAIVDVLAAHHLKQAVLCAMLRKKDTKKGSFVSVSLYDAALASLVNQATNFLMNGHVPERMGTQHPNIAPYGDCFICKDGKYIILAIGTDDQFRCFSNLMDIDEAEYRNNSERLLKRERLCEEIAAKLITEELSYWSQKFLELKIPFSPILDVGEALSTPEAEKRLISCEIEGVDTVRTRTAYI